MDAPSKPADDPSNPNPVTLCASLMQDGKWDAATLEKFKTLDKCKNSEAIKEELLKNKLDVLFELNCSGSKFEKEKFESTQPRPWTAHSKLAFDFPEGECYRFYNTPKFVSINHDGSIIAVSDAANLHYKNPRLKDFLSLCVPGDSIKSVKVLEHNNLLRIAQKEKIEVFNALAPQECKISETSGFKKTIFSPDGNWFLAKDYDNFTHLLKTTTIKPRTISIENPQAIAIDEQGKQGLIGTASDLFCVTITDDKVEFERVFGKDPKPIPNITCVDITPDGKFGLAINHFGFARISLSDPNAAFIDSYKSGTTIGRISNNGQIIVTGHKDGAVVINKVLDDNICEMSELNYLKTTGPITCLALSGDNKTLAAGSTVGFFTSSCKDLWKEFENLTPAQIVAFLRIYNAPGELDSRAVKKELVTIKSELKSKLLESLTPKRKEDIYCAICSERMSDMMTPCYHDFCSQCIQGWKDKGHNSCPTCRESLTP